MKKFALLLMFVFGTIVGCNEPAKKPASGDKKPDATKPADGDKKPADGDKKPDEKAK